MAEKDSTDSKQVDVFHKQNVLLSNFGTDFEILIFRNWSFQRFQDKTLIIKLIENQPIRTKNSDVFATWH